MGGWEAAQRVLASTWGQGALMNSRQQKNIRSREGALAMGGQIEK